MNTTPPAQPPEPAEILRRLGNRLLAAAQAEPGDDGRPLARLAALLLRLSEIADAGIGSASDTLAACERAVGQLLDFAGRLPASAAPVLAAIQAELDRADIAADPRPPHLRCWPPGDGRRLLGRLRDLLAALLAPTPAALEHVADRLARAARESARRWQPTATAMAELTGALTDARHARHRRTGGRP